MNKTVIGTGIVALVIGFGGGYATAHYTAVAPTQNMRGNFTGGSGTFFASGMRGEMNGGFLTGTVAAKDATSITLNTRDGNSHVVLLTGSTTISKSVSGSLSDVAVGSTVIISGTSNSDGSLSASLIQLRPADAQQAK